MRRSAQLLVAFSALTLALPVASAEFERHALADVDGVLVAVVLLDSDKAVRRGDERGFVLLVENLQAAQNVTARLEVVLLEPGLNVTLPATNATLGPGESGELAWRVEAPENATLVDVPVRLAVRLMSDDGRVVEHDLLASVRISALPTPLGESFETLSPGERAVATFGASALASVFLAAVALRAVGRP